MQTFQLKQHSYLSYSWLVDFLRNVEWPHMNSFKEITSPRFLESDLELAIAQINFNLQKNYNIMPVEGFKWSGEQSFYSSQNPIYHLNS